MKDSSNLLCRVAAMRDHIFASMMKTSVADLQTKCKALALPTYGAKELLIARIRIKLNLKIEQCNGPCGSGQANLVGRPSTPSSSEQCNGPCGSGQADTVGRPSTSLLGPGTYDSIGKHDSRPIKQNNTIHNLTEAHKEGSKSHNFDDPEGDLIWEDE